MVLPRALLDAGDHPPFSQAHRRRGTRKQIHIPRPPLQLRLPKRRKYQLHMPLTLGQIGVKPPPRKLRPDHAAPVRPHTGPSVVNRPGSSIGCAARERNSGRL